MDLRFPWLAHLVVAAALVAWIVWTDVTSYGIDTTGPLWTGGSGLAGLLAGFVLLVAGLPAAALEAWAVRTSDRRWPAWLVLGTYGFVAAVVAFGVTDLRFFDTQDPTELADLLLGVAAFVPMMAGQALAARAMCRVPFPSLQDGRGRRLAVRLGLMER